MPRREAREGSARARWPSSGGRPCDLHRRIAAVVLEALPDAIIVGDSTEPVYAGNQFYEAPGDRAPGSTPAPATARWAIACRPAIGAKLAAPDRPVVALVGDGGLQFTLRELASAVESRDAARDRAVWNNDGYGEIKTYMLERQIAPIGVDIFTPDFLAIAKGFGCESDPHRELRSIDEGTEIRRQAPPADTPRNSR